VGAEVCHVSGIPRFVGDILFISALLHVSPTTIFMTFFCVLACSDINLDYVRHNFMIIRAVRHKIWGNLRN
jgi:hypothetical protein